MTEIKMPRGWKTVPVPPVIDMLPKDRKGFPIPYVADWRSHEDDVHAERLGPRYGVLHCDCEPGVGEPRLGHQCPTRQKECMRERKCQVCSLSIPQDEDCYFLGGAPVETFWEPPLHLTCALYSLQVCPGITRRQGMSVTSCRDYQLYDRFEFSEDNQDAVFAPNGEIPLIVALGIRGAIIVYHGAVPIEGVRTPADVFLEESTHDVA